MGAPGLNPKTPLRPLDLAKQSIVELLRRCDRTEHDGARSSNQRAEAGAAGVTPSKAKRKCSKPVTPVPTALRSRCSYVDEESTRGKLSSMTLGMAYADRIHGPGLHDNTNVHQILEELGSTSTIGPEKEKLLVHGKKSGLPTRRFWPAAPGPERIRAPR